MDTDWRWRPPHTDSPYTAKLQTAISKKTINVLKGSSKTNHVWNLRDLAAGKTLILPSICKNPSSAGTTSALFTIFFRLHLLLEFQVQVAYEKCCWYGISVISGVFTGAAGRVSYLMHFSVHFLIWHKFYSTSRLVSFSCQSHTAKLLTTTLSCSALATLSNKNIF